MDLARRRRARHQHAEGPELTSRFHPALVGEGRVPSPMHRHPHQAPFRRFSRGFWEGSVNRVSNRRHLVGTHKMSHPARPRELFPWLGRSNRQTNPKEVDVLMNRKEFLVTAAGVATTL